MESGTITSPIKAIKEFCRQCNGGSVYEVKNCTSSRCPLYPFRLGKNPYRHTREMTDEQRAEAAERLKKARENKK